MDVRLNDRGFEHARATIRDGNYVVDDRDDWSEHQPSSQAENQFIAENGYTEYGRWFLGIDDDEADDTKARYKFPYGDFAKVHRCAVLAAESRAGQRRYFDIELATAHLHGMLEALGSRAHASAPG